MIVESSELLELESTLILKSILLGIEKVFCPYGNRRGALNINILRANYLQVKKISTKRKGALIQLESVSAKL